MELRHTLEILTKDIQDIEKLVGNLHNSDGDSSIELDLALSKLRNVYEVLTMIKADRLQEIGARRPLGETAPPEPTVSVDAPIPEPAQVPEPPVKTAAAPEPVSDAGDTGNEVENQEDVPGNQTGAATPKGKGILAEKFSAESSINENLAGKRSGGTDSRVMGQPIDNIHRNIGINDRFLIIRELFKGDADGFRELVQLLEEAGDLQKASELLKERFPEDSEHEGIEILEGLIKRRFSLV
jgi:hypothetical protein